MSVISQGAVEAPRSKLSYSAIAKYAEEIAHQHGVVDATGHVNVQGLLMKLGALQIGVRAVGPRYGAGRSTLRGISSGGEGPC